MQIGVLLDEATIIPGFDYIFYEVKPSSGRIHQPLPQAWNVVNCFADNTISKQNLNWSQPRREKAPYGEPQTFSMGLDLPEPT